MKVWLKLYDTKCPSSDGELEFTVDKYFYDMTIIPRIGETVTYSHEYDDEPFVVKYEITHVIHDFVNDQIMVVGKEHVYA